MRRAISDSKTHLDEFVRHDPHNARALLLGDRKYRVSRIRNPHVPAAKRAAAS